MSVYNFSSMGPAMKRTRVEKSSFIPHQSPRTKSSANVITSFGKTIQTYFIKFLKYLIEYCNNSSLHGLKYVFNTQLGLTERLFWLLLFLASLFIVISTSFHGIYKIWLDSPSLIVYESHFRPIWSIPFPSITICPYFAIKKSSIDLTTTNDSNMLYYASFACAMLKGSNKEFPKTNITNDFYSEITKVAPTCSDILKICTWRNTKIDCCKYFQPVLTDLGLCYNFNMLPFDHIYKNDTFVPYPSLEYSSNTVFWDQQNGYPDLSEISQNPVLPHRVETGGAHSSLKIEVFQDLNEWQDYCSGANSGFKVFINSPAELPVFSHSSVAIEMNRDNLLLITPDTMSSDSSISTIPPLKRNCLFNDEKPLQFFELYTHTNCILECRSLHQLNKCGCVQFFMPRNKTMQICSKPEEEACLYKSILELTKEAMKGNSQPDDLKAIKYDCECLLPCSQISMQVEKYYSDFIHINGVKPPWAHGSVRQDQVARAQIQYKVHSFLGNKVKHRYTLVSFIGKCGGLLSLFLGFSFISAFEIIYFFLIRPISKILHYKAAVCPNKINVKEVPLEIKFLH